MGNESTAVLSEVESKMSDQNIDCCPEICDKIQEVTKLSKDLSEMAKALKLSKDALSTKGKEILYFSDICANENIVQAVNNVSDSITPNEIQSSVNDVTKNGSEFAIAQTSKLVNGMHEFAVASKSKNIQWNGSNNKQFSKYNKLSYRKWNSSWFGVWIPCCACLLTKQEN